MSPTPLTIMEQARRSRATIQRNMAEAQAKYNSLAPNDPFRVVIETVQKTNLSALKALDNVLALDRVREEKTVMEDPGQRAATILRSLVQRLTTR